jgi:hypothetical protein
VYLQYAAVTRSRIGAHHLLYQEPDRIFAVERAPIRGARLSDGNVAGSVMRATAGRGNGRSCPHLFWPFPNDFAR